MRVPSRVAHSRRRAMRRACAQVRARVAGKGVHRVFACLDTLDEHVLKAAIVRRAFAAHVHHHAQAVMRVRDARLLLQYGIAGRYREAASRARYEPRYSACCRERPQRGSERYVANIRSTTRAA